MEIRNNGNLIATVKDDVIIFEGTDLNPMLNERLVSVEPSYEEDGVIIYNEAEPTTLAKLTYLESIGFEVVLSLKEWVLI